MFDIDCGVYAHIGTSRQRGRDADIFPVNSNILVDVYAFVKISMPWRMKEKLDAVKLLIVQGKVSTVHIMIIMLVRCLLGFVDIKTSQLERGELG